MVRKLTLRRLALATCPWLALSLQPGWAQEPTLADPAQETADFGYLLGSPGGQQAQPDPAEEVSAVEEQPAAEPTSEATEPTPVEADETAPVGVATPQPVVQGAAPALEEGSGELGPKVETIRERYPNRRVRIEREVTQDALGNYLNHGVWKMWDERGGLMAEGRNTEGLRQGVWNRWHARNDSNLFAQYPYAQFTPPFISQAEFKDGNLSGIWTIYDSKQRKISQWNFINGQRHGLSMWWHPNGKKLREITYKDGSIDGEVIEFSDAGQITRRSTFQQGRQLAPRTENHADGSKKTQGMYLHAPMVVKTPDDWWNALPAVFTHVGKDERHGDWVAWYPNGQEQLRGRYKNDKEDGTFVWWYQNGQKAAEGEYVSGLQQGTWVWWHKNGQKSTEGSYRDGDQFGRWTVWNELGRVTQASEHVGTEHKSIEVTNTPATPVETEAAAVPTPAEAAAETATAPRLLTPGKSTR